MRRSLQSDSRGYPGMGLMRAADFLESLKHAPRWASV